MQPFWVNKLKAEFIEWECFRLFTCRLIHCNASINHIIWEILYYNYINVRKKMNRELRIEIKHLSCTYLLKCKELKFSIHFFVFLVPLPRLHALNSYIYVLNISHEIILRSKNHLRYEQNPTQMDAQSMWLD